MRRALVAGAALLLGGGCARGRPSVLWVGGDVYPGPGAPGGAGRGLGGLAGRLDGPLFANLEGCLGDPAGARLEAPLRLIAPSPAAPWLRAGGLAFASVENNHADDCGPTGRAATRKALEQAGIRAVGPVGVDAGGLSLVAVHVASDEDVERAAQAVGRIRGPVPLIVSLHVDDPPSHLPSPLARRAANALARAGAVAVIGHGPHAIQGAAWIGRTLVLYGLGNLLFGCACTDRDEALLARLTLDRRGVVEARLMPILAGLVGRGPFEARTPPREDAARIAALVADLSAAEGTRTGGGRGTDVLVRRADR